ncbi:MAG: hypothetical protein IEMM0006_0483 [bacterium]|nr:MAG: hypothetical protein IEMM0006_0483 [bacterium]
MLLSKLIYRLLTLSLVILWICPGAIGKNPTTYSPAQQTDTSLAVRATDSLQIVQMIDRGLREIEKTENVQAQNKFHSVIEDAINLARKSGLLLLTGKKINEAGKQLRYEARYPLALWLHKKGIEIGKKTGNAKLLILSYNNLGVVFRRIDSYQKAMDYHLKALHLATKMNDSVSMAIAINSIGNVNLMIGNNDKALQYFKRSLELAQNRNNPLGIAINMNNIGHAYEQKGFLTKALRYYEVSLSINKRIHSKKGIVICSNDIANVLGKQGKYIEALRYSKRAILLATEINDLDNLAYSYVSSGALYGEINDFKNAFHYLESGIKLAKKIRARSILEDGYAALFKTYMGMKKYKKAISYLKLKQVYHDSLLNLEVRKNIARMQIQFDTERQKNQIALQKQQTKIAMLSLKKQKYLLYFAWSAFAIVLIVLAFVSFYLYNKNRQNYLLKEKNREIEKAQNELKDINKALIQAIEKAKNSAQAKSNFLANMSHEIRTPLNSVIGFSDLLFTMATDEKQKSYLLAIKSSGKSLLGLINDILDLSKIEKGNIDLKFKETDIRKIIVDVVNIFDPEVSEKNLHLVTEIDDNLPPGIVFEETRLRQILFNLVGNAIKFTRKGEITISARFEPEHTPGKIKLIIGVEDTGPGIPLEEQDSVFMPFYQAQTSEKANGTGLGLAISQRLTNAMHGEMKLKSTPGKGSLFSVIFHDVQVGSKIAVTAPKTKASPDRSSKKCLFINQPHPIKNELKQVFISHGFEVDDVGLNLSLAKKNILQFRLVVFCCLKEETLQNALNIFEKENLDNKHVFLILNINDGFHIDKTKAFVIQLFNRNVNEIKDSLREFIRQFDEDECARQLFSLKESTPEEELFKEIEQLYQHDFEPAVRTKMFDKIEVFTQHLQQIAMGYQLPNLMAFTNDLNRHLKNFDVVAIEKQLRIFKKAFTLSFNTR